MSLKTKIRSYIPGTPEQEKRLAQLKAAKNIITEIEAIKPKKRTLNKNLELNKARKVIRNDKLTKTGGCGGLAIGSSTLLYLLLCLLPWNKNEAIDNKKDTPKPGTNIAAVETNNDIKVEEIAVNIDPELKKEVQELNEKYIDITRRQLIALQRGNTAIAQDIENKEYQQLLQDLLDCVNKRSDVELKINGNADRWATELDKLGFFFTELYQHQQKHHIFANRGHIELLTPLTKIERHRLDPNASKALGLDKYVPESITIDIRSLKNDYLGFAGITTGDGIPYVNETVLNGQTKEAFIREGLSPQEVEKALYSLKQNEALHSCFSKIFTEKHDDNSFEDWQTPVKPNNNHGFHEFLSTAFSMQISKSDHLFLNSMISKNPGYLFSQKVMTDSALRFLMKNQGLTRFKAKSILNRLTYRQKPYRSFAAARNVFLDSMKAEQYKELVAHVRKDVIDAARNGIEYLGKKDLLKPIKAN